MKNILKVCRVMNDVLCNPSFHKKINRIEYEYDLDEIVSHIIECETCKKGFIEVYKKQDIPIFLKNLIDSLIQNKLKVKL